MRKLLIGAALCALFAAPALAGEPAKVTTKPVTLTLDQMDKVSAGGWIDVLIRDINANIAVVEQANVNTSAFSSVEQKNVAVVKQEIED
jgi:hypothetical protein